MSGTVNIARALWDDPTFKDSEMSQREAWIWLIAEASWKPRPKRVGSVSVNLERGQLAASTRFLATAWGWSEARVRRYFDMLENRRMIHRETDAGVSVVTICNYDNYQSKPKGGDAASTQRATHQRRTSDANDKKGEIRGKKEDTPKPPEGVADDGFDRFWAAYPHRGGQKKNRRGAEVKFQAAIRRGVPAETILEGVKRMGSFPDVARGYARDPVTWLNQEGWIDEPPSAGLSVIPGGRGTWRYGDIRIVRDHVQEFFGEHWERRNDLTPAEVEEHPRLIARIG